MPLVALSYFHLAFKLFHSVHWHLVVAFQSKRNWDEIYMFFDSTFSICLADIGQEDFQEILSHHKDNVTDVLCLLCVCVRLCGLKTHRKTLKINFMQVTRQIQTCTIPYP